VRGGDLEAENRELRKRTKQLKQENEILRRATAYFARDCKPRTQQRSSCHAVVHIVLNACPSSLEHLKFWRH
jgi:transposase-like protein